MTVRIATRRSALAMAQAHQTGMLITARTGADVELVPMATTGDRNPNRAVGDFDVKGMFVDTVRRAVLDGDCDLVIHSFKDLPTEPVEGLAIGAVPRRADPRDVLITRDGHAFANLPPTAIIGTSSERRKIQLLKVKPGLQVIPIRGNLDTRLRKVADGEYDGVVIAAAGMQRLFTSEEQGGIGALGLPLKAYLLEPGECVPAPAQGALAVECRADDDDALAICKQINHLATRAQVTAERAFLQTLGGGCLAAVGALCTLTGVGALELIGLMGDAGRRRLVRLSAQGPYKDPEALGARLAADVATAMGGGAL